MRGPQRFRDTHHRVPAGAGPQLNVWLIAVGDELVQGRTLDTNSQEILRALHGWSVTIRSVTQVPDAMDAIASTLAVTTAGSLVFLCGGLGSTPDDLTREAVATWAGVALVSVAELQAALAERCRRHGIPAGDWIIRQSQVPAGMAPLANRVGSAPGLVGTLRDRTLVLLPGVPSELRGLLPDVMSWLQQSGLLPPARHILLYRTAQLAETTVVQQCAAVRQAHADLHWSWWLARHGVDLQVIVPAHQATPDYLTRLDAELRSCLEPWTYATQDQELSAVVQELMIRQGKTLSVAESCTAGLLGARLTEHAGSSAYFRGGVQVYADEVKRDVLGVSAEVLATDGAVSRGAAIAMAERCRERFRTDLAVAITGIAGPAGGSEAKPVGTTWIAVACPGVTWVRRYQFPGSRQRNRHLAVAAALDTVRRLLVDGDTVVPWHPRDSWGRSA